MVKVARTDRDNLSIQDEDRLLQSLRGAEHIIQLLYSGPAKFFRRSLVVEYVEHGQWEDVFERAYKADRRIPNRMLWGIFLCCNISLPTYDNRELLG